MAYIRVSREIYYAFMNILYIMKTYWPYKSDKPEKKYYIITILTIV